MDLDDINIDFDKIRGEFIDYGRFIKSFSFDKITSLLQFMRESFLLLKGILANTLPDKKAFTVLKMLIKAQFTLMQGLIENLSFEELKLELKKAEEEINKKIPEIKKLIGKDEDDFFL